MVLPEVTWRELTCHVPGSGPDRIRKWSHAHAQSVHVCHCAWPTGLPEVTWHRRGFPWVCICTTGSCAISVLVGPFDRKWRYETSSVVTEGHVTRSFPWVCTCATGSCAISAPSGAFWPEVTSSPIGLPLEVGECSLGRPRLSLSSPGYLPHLFSYNISIITYKVCCFRIYCVVLQGWYFYFTKSQMNEMCDIFIMCFVLFLFVTCFGGGNFNAMAAAAAAALG